MALVPYPIVKWLYAVTGAPFPMCIYCDGYEEKVREEGSQLSVGHNQSERKASSSSSKSVLGRLRASVSDLFY